MLLDGVGVPGLETALHGRTVLVVAPGADRAAELRRLKHFIREERPVLVGVGSGRRGPARGAGHTPAWWSAPRWRSTPSSPARPSTSSSPPTSTGTSRGSRACRTPASTRSGFPSSANPEDMALLLAHRHGASLVVACGFDATLTGFLDRGRSGSNPSTVLTRLRLGPTLVDGAAVASLHRQPGHHRRGAAAAARRDRRSAPRRCWPAGSPRPIVMLVREGWLARRWPRSRGIGG